MSEERELAVYITAKCSNCEGAYICPSETIYSRRRLPPDGEEYTYEFDCKLEERKLLEEYKAKNIPLVNYCPHCGAKNERI